MKKYKYLWFSLFIGAISVSLISCAPKKEIVEVQEEEYRHDDSTSIEAALTKEYDLDELKTFFEEHHINELANSKNSKLSYRDVEKKFPIEILRTGGYTVYKVRQGGYFYVFWVENLPIDGNTKGNELFVSFTAYITGDVNPEPFFMFSPEINTAQDIKRIDSTVEFLFLKNGSIYSYSYLSDSYLMEIEYDAEEDWNEYGDLKIRKMKMVPRKDAPSRYSPVLTKDLPI